MIVSFASFFGDAFVTSFGLIQFSTHARACQHAQRTKRRFKFVLPQTVMRNKLTFAAAVC